MCENIWDLIKIYGFSLEKNNFLILDGKSLILKWSRAAQSCHREQREFKRPQKWSAAVKEAGKAVLLKTVEGQSQLLKARFLG